MSQWNDASGNGHHATQGTTSDQPTFVASDTDFNNQPHVHFDGNDELAIPFSADLNPNNMTVFIVATVDSDTGTYQGIINNYTSNTGWLLYAKMSGSDNYWQVRTGTGSAQTIISAATDSVVPNTPSIVTFQISGSDGSGGGTTVQTLSVNGTVAATSSAVFTKKTSTSNTPILGQVGSFQLTGQMAEVVMFNRALSTEERKQVEAYLATKYGISGTAGFKTSNPYETATFPAVLGQTNFADKSVKFLVRPVRMLDKQHVEIFRPNNSLHSGSPQYGPTAYSATAGGKYGVFAYEMPNSRASAVYMRGGQS